MELFLLSLYATWFGGVSGAIIPRADQVGSSSSSSISFTASNATLSSSSSATDAKTLTLQNVESSSDEGTTTITAPRVVTRTLQLVSNPTPPSSLSSLSSTPVSSSVGVSISSDGTTVLPGSSSTANVPTITPFSSSASATRVTGSGDDQVRTLTLTLPYTFDALSTTVIWTSTFTDYLSTHRAPNGERCQYWGDCPSPPVFPTELQSLSSANAQAEASACSKTVDMDEATAEFYTSTFTSTIRSTITHTDNTVVGTRTFTPGMFEVFDVGTTLAATTISRNPYQRVGCGGVCMIHYYNVKVMYWPPPEWKNGSNCVKDPNWTNTFPELTVRDVEAVPTAVATMVNEDGYTFTSPSVYVGFGAVSATNDYGYVGEVHSSFTLAFAPGELYTEFNPLGFGAPEFTSYPFDPHNVTCNSRPVIAFPTKLQGIDPKWTLCSGGGAYQGNDPPIALTPQGALLDPATSVDPQTTKDAGVTQPPAAPASTTASMFNPTPMPEITENADPEPADPEPEDPKPADPEPADPRPTDPQPVDPEPNNDPKENNEPAPQPQPQPTAQKPEDPKTSPNNPAQPTPPSQAGESSNQSDPANPPAQAAAAGDQSNSNPTNGPGTSNSPAAVDPGTNNPPAQGRQPQDTPQPDPTHNIADAIMTALGFTPRPSAPGDNPPSTPDTPGTGNAPSSPNDPAMPSFPADGPSSPNSPDSPNSPAVADPAAPRVSIIDPSRVVIGSATLSAGAEPTVLSGHTIAFTAPNALALDSSTIGLLPTPDAQGNLAIGSSGAVASVVDASRVVIAGQTVTAGSAPTTLDGQEVSLESGTLKIGSSQFDVAHSGTEDSAAAEPYATTVSGRLTTVTPAATALPSVVTLESGETLTKGGATVTVSGTELHYDASGVVHSGSVVLVPTSSAGGDEWTLVKPSSAGTGEGIATETSNGAEPTGTGAEEFPLATGAGDRLVSEGLGCLLAVGLGLLVWV